MRLSRSTTTHNEKKIDQDRRQKSIAKRWKISSRFWEVEARRDWNHASAHRTSMSCKIPANRPGRYCSYSCCPRRIQGCRPYSPRREHARELIIHHSLWKMLWLSKRQDVGRPHFVGGFLVIATLTLTSSQGSTFLECFAWRMFHPFPFNSAEGGREKNRK